MSGSTYGTNPSQQQQSMLGAQFGGAGQLGSSRYNLASKNPNMSQYQTDLASLNAAYGGAGQLGSNRYNLMLNQLNARYNQTPTPAPIAKPVVTPPFSAIPVTGPVVPQPIQAPINMQGTIGMPAGPGFMQPPAVKNPIVAPIAPTPLPASQQFTAMPMTTPAQSIVPSGVKVSNAPGSILRLRSK
jgi:hypothetical protein